MKNPPYLSLNEAAKQSGRSKGTISKALSNKKMGYVSKENGRYQIDPSELERVFPKKQVSRTENDQNKNTENSNKTAMLELELQFKNEQIASLKEQLEKDGKIFKTQLEKEEKNTDDWKTELETMRLLLTNDNKTKTSQNKGIIERAGDLIGKKWKF